MRRRCTFSSALVAVVALTVLALGLAGCAPAAPPPTSTPEPTATPPPPPTKTPTPKPTSTSTATPIPTPAAVGDVVPYDPLEITVVKMDTHDLIVPGGKYYYYPQDRTRVFLDLGVLVRNTKPGSPVSISWKDISIVEANGRAWWPAFADTKTVDPGKSLDPFSIGIATQIDGEGSISFDDDTYLRLIFIIAKDQMIVFRVAGSPPVTFTIGK